MDLHWVLVLVPLLTPSPIKTVLSKSTLFTLKINHFTKIQTFIIKNIMTKSINIYLKKHKSATYIG